MKILVDEAKDVIAHNLFIGYDGTEVVTNMNYLNTDTPRILFERTLNNEIYVDKSLLISKLSKNIHTGNNYICVTRPRRFGKTVNAAMLGAYYTRGYDSHALFDSLAISQTADYEKYMNQYHVIYIDFSRMPDFCLSYQDYILFVREQLMEDLRNAYPVLAGKQFTSISNALRATGDFFVFILDEWDSVFYQKFMSTDDKSNFLLFLKGLLKDQPYVELAYMTGVLPIRKYSSGSELNMFREHNFMNDRMYEEYFGFTEDEVASLCQEHTSVSYDVLKKWYDGYRISDGRSLFNPRSVTFALMDGECLNYWTETGPMNEVAECVEHNVDAVREDMVKLIAGIPVRTKLQGYSAAELQLNTRDEILSAMVVYGFLSYHDGYLCIPNFELMEKFQDVLMCKSMGAVQEIVEKSREMLAATLNGDEAAVVSILEEVHDREIPFLQYNDENALSCVITLCYLSARDDYAVERESKSGKGYCDYLFTPQKTDLPAIILELKVNDSCENAIAQIKERNYMQKVHGCKEIILVGISYDAKKHHRCRIERLCNKRL